MTRKQQRFVTEYLVDCNATQAAIRAGYSEQTARFIGAENLSKPYIKQAIADKMEEMKSERIADAEEIIIYLTSVLRGQSESSVVLVCDNEVVTVTKTPDEKERLKAAELLGKRYGLFTDKVNLEGAVPVIISGEDQLED